MNRYTVEIRVPRKGETIINQGRVIEMPVDGTLPMAVVVDGSDRWPSGNAIFIEDAVCDGEEVHGTYAVRSVGWTYMLPDGLLIGKDTPNHEITARGSSTVTAYGSSAVTACDSSAVAADDSVAIHEHDPHATIAGGVIIDHTTADATTITPTLERTDR